MQCISYHSCCAYLECGTPRLYSVYLGSNRPTATDSFVKGATPMGLGYSDNHHKSRFVFPLRTPLNVSLAIRGDIFAACDACTLVLLLMEALSKNVQVIVIQPVGLQQ